ncbi:MAG: hypothetical protein JSR99_13855 [Proteobacteria bacterium]|nr:hypothetical protein [Pseudomonadota bacterium]
MAGITTVSLLVVVFVGTVVGAIAGMFLGNSIPPDALLAVLAGLAGTVAGAVARNVLVDQGIAVGEYESALPLPILIYAAVASFIGSLAGLEVALLVGEAFPVWIGALAGLLSSILTGLLVIAYHHMPPR